MLCSKAEGTPLAADAINIAVPGTRVALLAADFMKISIGIVLSAMRSRIKARPRDHVVNNVKMTKPITKGTHPPDGTFNKLAPN